MKNFIAKNYILIVILKCFILINSISNVYYFYSNNIQLFNDNIVSFSQRFLIGKYIILIMVLHIIFEAISTQNMFSFYSTKYRYLNYFLGAISIIISLPLLYNFADDFIWSGRVSPFKFFIPILYLIIGVTDFIIAGKKLDE